MSMATILAAVAFGLLIEPLVSHRSRAAEMERSLEYLPGRRLRRCAIAVSGGIQLLLVLLSFAVALEWDWAPIAMGVVAMLTACAYLAHVRKVISSGGDGSCGCSMVGGSVGYWSYFPAALLLLLGLALPAAGLVEAGSGTVAEQAGLLLIAASIGLTIHSLAGVLSIRGQAWIHF